MSVHSFCRITWLVGITCWLLSYHGEVTAGEESRYALHYSSPASEWTAALPVGNGRLGAMVFGGTNEARWQINEDTVWTGGPRSYAHPGAAGHVGRLRELLFQNKQREAESLAIREFMSVPLRQMSYQPCVDLKVNLHHGEASSDYQRDLNLGTATTTTRYHSGGVNYRRTTFASFPHQVIVVHLACDQPGKLGFEVSLQSLHEQIERSTDAANTLSLRGRVRDVRFDGNSLQRGQIRFQSTVKVADTDGQVKRAADSLTVMGASHATLLLAAATNFVNYRDVSGDPADRCERALAAAAALPYEALLKAHQRDHRALFDRVDFQLTSSQSTTVDTDERIFESKNQFDPGLSELLFHYGRYLMIASSRPGGQPANLQGLWNDQLNPPWDSKYTININTEMNYWLADVCNLAPCAEPLYDAIEDLAESGTEVAREHYDADGWVLHHNFDLWRGAAPINHSNHGIWPTGGAWLALHLWEHYRFSGDEKFLRDRGYPLLRSASRFFCDYLVVDPRSDQNYLISGPSNSPEQGGLVMGPTMDHQIIRALFAATIEASRKLGVDSELRSKLEEMLPRIAPNKIGQHGQLQEWLEDVDDPGNHHRHVSHLWAVYPGYEITPAQPDLFAAAQKSLEMRGPGGTGWAIAWKINLWSRFRDGNRAESALADLLTLTHSPRTPHRGGGVYTNLFDAHPPFQIDGNFGATSGICEMLLQSHQLDSNGNPLVELLPALPDRWPSGSFRGLCSRGGLVVDAMWSDGKLSACKITSRLGRPATLVYREHRQAINLGAGGNLQLHGDLSASR